MTECTILAVGCQGAGSDIKAETGRHNGEQMKLYTKKRVSLGKYTYSHNCMFMLNCVFVDWEKGSSLQKYEKYGCVKSVCVCLCMSVMCASMCLRLEEI